MTPTIEWHERVVRMIDQRKIPWKLEWYTCKGYRDVIGAIQKMVIRGAPAIGVAGAMGLALGVRSIKAKTFAGFKHHYDRIAEEMAGARPTAVNLAWAVDRVTRLVQGMEGQPLDAIREAVEKESRNILAEDIAINRKIGEYGQRIVPGQATILTHCNAGSLATGGYGTALGVIRAAHEAGKRVSVIADETRPWLQGLRLTAFELVEEGIPVTVIVDSAAGSLMRQKRIDMVITGADRIAGNGDVANKIGTYQAAVLARENGIPFYVAAPLSTIDISLAGGDLIPVEERSGREITRVGNREMGPAGVRTLNPAFDITPNDYVEGIITEKGIVRSPYRAGLREIVNDPLIEY